MPSVFSRPRISAGTLPVEEAFLAAMDDASECVRIAAVQGIIDATERCGICGNGCVGCCTLAIQSRLQYLAYATDENGCWCKPSPKVRRLARIACCRCSPVQGSATAFIPEEIPSPAVVELSRAPIVAVRSANGAGSLKTDASFARSHLLS